MLMMVRLEIGHYNSRTHQKRVADRVEESGIHSDFLACKQLVAHRNRGSLG
jgi:hypothetical protein